jgi:hypothetical protein
MLLNCNAENSGRSTVCFYTKIPKIQDEPYNFNTTEDNPMLFPLVRYWLDAEFILLTRFP